MAFLGRGFGGVGSHAQEYYRSRDLGAITLLSSVYRDQSSGKKDSIKFAKTTYRPQKARTLTYYRHTHSLEY